MLNRTNVLRGVGGAVPRWRASKLPQPSWGVGHHILSSPIVPKSFSRAVEDGSLGGFFSCFIGGVIVRFG
ncbi:hypothetical protein DIPPA_21107 [Diplonema papillatum]|nr:hypothetical protein DIPPA_21107 [Diplonema papillatum]